MINPDIPLDEQTDALPYDIGWEFPLGNLKMGMLLGQGAFGRVLKAEAMNIEEGVSSTTVAVKAVRGGFLTTASFFQTACGLKPVAILYEGFILCLYSLLLQITLILNKSRH